MPLVNLSTRIPITPTMFIMTTTTMSITETTLVTTMNTLTTITWTITMNTIITTPTSTTLLEKGSGWSAVRGPRPSAGGQPLLG